MKYLVTKALAYFSRFQYPPTFEEIRMFYPKKVSRKRLQGEIDELVKRKKIVEIHFYHQDELKTKRYSLGEYSKKIQNSKFRIQNFIKKYKNSLEKIGKIQVYLKLINLFPQIRLVGLSGSVAMMNAEKSDDIDLFIITARNRLWTGRFIAVALASILRIRRLRIAHEELSTKDKVCLNLFFDEKRMEVPDFKKTAYVAHEILQMKPLIIRGDIYNRFLKANSWIFKWFPNANNSKFIIQKSKLHSESILDFIAGRIELLLKYSQLLLVRKHMTSEMITSSQLWFFPEDFERNFSSLNDQGKKGK